MTELKEVGAMERNLCADKGSSSSQISEVYSDVQLDRNPEKLIDSVRDWWRMYARSSELRAAFDNTQPNQLASVSFRLWTRAELLEQIDIANGLCDKALVRLTAWHESVDTGIYAKAVRQIDVLLYPLELRVVPDGYVFIGSESCSDDQPDFSPDAYMVSLDWLGVVTKLEKLQ